MKDQDPSVGDGRPGSARGGRCLSMERLADGGWGQSPGGLRWRPQGSLSPGAGMRAEQAVLTPSVLACFPLAAGHSSAPSSPARTFLRRCAESHRHFCQQQDTALRTLPSIRASSARVVPSRRPRDSPAAARVCRSRPHASPAPAPPQPGSSSRETNAGTAAHLLDILIGTMELINGNQI